MNENNWAGKDFYAILGVPPTASLEEIKSEYRWLAKKFHPDTNSGDERSAKRFQEINEAYEVLSNSRLRPVYDQSRAGRQKTGEKPPYPNRGGPRDSNLGEKPPTPFQHGPSSESARNKGDSPPAEPSSRKTGLYIALPVLGIVLVSSIFVAIGVMTSATSQPRSSSFVPSASESRAADLETCNLFWNFDYPANWYNSIEASQGVATRIRGMARTGNSLPVRGAINGLVSQMDTYAATLRLQQASGTSIANGNEFAAPNVISADKRLESVCEQVFRQ